MAVTRNIVLPVLLLLSAFCFASGKVGKCEKIKIPMCQGIGYNLTYMPNMFNHSTQGEAALEVHQFWPLVENKCSPDLKFFLCSIYAPMCQPNFRDEIPPCRSVCERARKGCAPLMRQYGLSWPEQTTCENFPALGGDKLCMGRNATESYHSSRTSPPTKSIATTVTKTSNEKKCEKIKIPMCQGIGYNFTYMPNMFNHDTQEEAALEVHQFWPLIKVNCSPDIKFFLCSMYAPICQPNFKDDVPPCRSVCERAKKGCVPFMRRFGFSWPKHMQCDNFPEDEGNGLCLDSDRKVKAKHTITTSRPTKSIATTVTKTNKEKKCEKIKIPMCQGIGYNFTYMPNMFNQRTQEAALEVYQFWPLVENKCSPDLKFFLCSMYAPMCQLNFKDEVPPCRSICKRARKGCAPLMRRFGFSWPKRMQCDNFPEDGGDKLCLDRDGRVIKAKHTTTSTRPTKLITTIVSKTSNEKKCEKIKIPMCQSIGYNLTYMPNMFKHRTQEEAALEVHQFWPLVENKCSSDIKFFLCSMFAPMCQPNFKDEVPPCRSICERARKGCAPLMRQYGFSWPERMQCDNFPEDGGEKLCLGSDRKVKAKHMTTTSRPTKSAATTVTKTSKEKKCEKIKIPMCQGIGYNFTYMPNMFKHRTQEEAALEVHYFWPLVKVNCSPDLKFFLCSMYAPMCQPNLKDEVPPCRSICKRARKGCAPLMRRAGIKWPKRFRCKNFPDPGSGRSCRMRLK